MAGSSAISVIIPAFNEESYIGATLDAVREATAHSNVPSGFDIEVIVVDNASTDRTADIARSKGARVVEEPRGNVAIARNAGARAANGRVLVFVDADTYWPRSVLSRILEVMSDRQCLGGAVDTDYRPKSYVVHAYLRIWRIIGRLCRMAQGATQFCDAATFFSLGGYDETMFMGEDVDFYWRLRQSARAAGSRVELIDDVRVVPSCRRFDNWPFWKTLLWTNPATCLLFAHQARPWRDWYASPIR